MDFATGLREAKLLDGEDNDVQVATDIVLDAANVADKDQAVALVVAEPAVESAPSSSTVQPAPIPVIHRNRALEIELDEVLTLLTGSSTVDVSTSELVVDRIQLLDVYAHDFKDGQALLANATVLDALVTAMLEHASPNVRASIAVIIGSALENNPGAQDLAMAYRRRQTGSGSGSGTVTERDLFQLVLDRMDVEPDRRAADELLFLLSSLVRGNDVATQKLFDSTAVAETPLTRLRLGPMVNVGERTRQKAIHLVTDAVRFMTESGGKDGVGMPANAVEELQPWCDLFRAEAGNASSLLREDAQEALDVVDGVCKGINLTQ